MEFPNRTFRCIPSVTLPIGMEKIPPNPLVHEPSTAARNTTCGKRDEKEGGRQILEVRISV
jgi:hypothetical protein